jgi:hypothetical protein
LLSTKRRHIRKSKRKAVFNGYENIR